MTFDEYRDSIPIDPASGAYMVEGDIRVWDDEELEEFYHRSRAGDALTVGITGPTGAKVDIKYDNTRKMDLSFCISNGFTTTHKTALVSALNSAMAEWENATKIGSGAATIDFKYLSAKDGAGCTRTSSDVFFNVEPASMTATYYAAAFFPDDARSMRYLDVHTSAFAVTPPETLAGTLRHELGHILGFPHEHIRKPSLGCTDPSAPAEYRGISPYEYASVMHYHDPVGPGECGSSGIADDILSTYDKSGVRCIYNPAADACKGMQHSGSGVGFAADSNGVIYRINAANTAIDKYSVTTVGLLPTWTTVNTVSGTSAIMAGGTTLWRIRSSDNTLHRWTGSAWTNFANVASKVVVAHSSGDAFRLEADGKISRIAATAATAVAAFATAATGRTIFPGLNTVYRVDSDGTAHKWNSGTSWTQIASDIAEVAADQKGTVYARKSDGRVYAANSAGVWTQIGTGMAALHGGLADTIYATKTGTSTVARYAASRAAFEDYALSVSRFFGGGPRKLMLALSTNLLFDYLYSE